MIKRNEALSKYYLDFIETHSTGLSVVNLPTGTGKTYSVAHMIKENFGNVTADYAVQYVKSLNNLFPSENNRKIRGYVFVLPNRSGLEQFENEFKDLIAKDRDLSFSDKLIFRDYSVLDNLVGKSRRDYVLNLLEELHKRSVFKDIPNIKELYDDLTDYISSNSMSDTHKKKLEDDITTTDAKFRGSLRAYLINEIRQKHFGGKSVKIELHDYIDEFENNPKWSWIFKLYPSCLIHKYPIILMTARKLLGGYVSVFEDNTAYLSADFLRDRIFFLDEFDSDKEVFRDSIIEQSLRDGVSFFELSKNILRCLKKIHQTKQECFSVPRDITDSSGRVELKDIYAQFKDLSNRYYLQHNYKSVDTTNTSRFMFHDPYTISLMNNIQGVYFRYNPTTKVVDIHFGKIEDFRETFSLYNLLRDCHRCVNHFISYASRYYKNIMKFHNKTHSEQITEEDALISLLSEIPDCTAEDIAFLKREIVKYQMLRRNYDKRNNIQSNRVHTFYDHGVSFARFEDAPQHIGFTKFMYYSMVNTPENILATLFNSAVVFGISATGKSQSIDNYNFEYLQNKYNELIEFVPKSVSDEFLASFRDYWKKKDIIKKISIDVVKPFSDDDFEAGEFVAVNKFLNTLFDSNLATDLTLILTRACSQITTKRNKKDQYYRFLLRRYCSIVYVMKEFWSSQLTEKNSCNSLLSLSSKMPTASSANQSTETDISYDFSEDVLRDIFTKIGRYTLNCRGVNEDKTRLKDKCPQFFVLRGTGKVLADEISRINKIRAEKIPVFVMSAYATLGRNLNLTTEECREDYDAIYLDKPSYLLPSYDTFEYFITDLGKIDVEKAIDAYKYLIYFEEFYERACLNGEDLNYLKERLNCLKNNPRARDLIEKLRSDDPTVAKGIDIVVQSLGRLFRTTVIGRKRFFVNSDLYTDIQANADYIREAYVSTPFIEALLPTITENTCAETNEAENICIVPEVISYNEEAAFSKKTRHSYLSFSHFIPKGQFLYDHRKTWEQLRDFMLCVSPFPTKEQINEWAAVNNPEFDTDLFFGQSDKPINSYYYITTSFKYYRDTYYSFTGASNFRPQYIQSYGAPNIVSAESARLPQILNIPGMRDYFKEHNYATEFKPSEIFALAPLFVNIYKGALGEVAGRFVLDSYGLKVNAIADMSKYEIGADGVFADYPNVYVDFKSYSEKTPAYMNEEELNKRYLHKANDILQGYLVIANILNDNDYTVYKISDKILVVPALVYSNGNLILNNLKAIQDFCKGAAADG